MAVNLDLGLTRTIIPAAASMGMLRNQLAYVLATGKWETNHTMLPVREAYWKDEDWRRRNLRYYPWYGRGLAQLTWEDNYKRAQRELGLGTRLTDDPDAALDPAIAVNVILLGMTEGWFTGKKLSDYITLGKSHFVPARRIVNGNDQAAKIAAIAKEYDAALKAEGYGVTVPIPAPAPDATVAALTARVAALEAWAASFNPATKEA